MMANRYFLDRDESGHWYLVQAQHRRAWLKWTEQEEECETPPYAERLPGNPSDVTFEMPTW